MRIQKLHPDAIIPNFAHPEDAGLDLYALESVSVSPNQRVQVRIGIALAIPVGCVGLIWDKSGISHKGGLKTLGGVVDAGYRGEVLVGLVNLGQEKYQIEKGAKIAQMLIQRVEHPEIEVVEMLDDTPRGAGGFGSTGA